LSQPGDHAPICGIMQHLDLSDEEAAALIKELADITGNDRYPFSARIQTLRAILAKLKAEPAREPLPRPKVYAPPRAAAARRRKATARITTELGYIAGGSLSANTVNSILSADARSQIVIEYACDCGQFSRDYSEEKFETISNFFDKTTRCSCN
jgi:hypothetical protein